MNPLSIEIRMRVENLAINAALTHFAQKPGWSVQHVSGKPGHSGYDLFATDQRGKHVRIEVKGSSHEWQIPDLYSSEVDPSTGLLVADLLCLVYCVAGVAKSLTAIPREEIRPDELWRKATYYISGKVKKASRIGKYSVVL